MVNGECSWRGAIGGCLGRHDARAGSVEPLRASKRKVGREKDGSDDYRGVWSTARRLLFRVNGTRFTKQLRRDGRASLSLGRFETPRKSVVEEADDELVAQWEKSPAAKIQSSWLRLS